MNTNLLKTRVFFALSIFFAINTTAQAQEDEPAFRKHWAESSHTTVQAKVPVTWYFPEITGIGPPRNPSLCSSLVVGDFELQRSVPYRINNLGGGFATMAAPGDIIASDLTNWISPTGATPDYYAANASNPDARPGTAVYGPFTPYASSQGAVGLFARTQQRYGDAVGEYIEASLALTPGKYYGQFQVSLTQNWDVSNCGVASGFGFQVSQGRLPGASQTMRSFLAPVGKGVLSTSPIDQSYVNAWHRVSGQFDVTTGDNRLTLGLFNSDSLNFVGLPHRNPLIRNAYFFVDNVELYRIPTAGPNVSCSSQSKIIGEGCRIPGATYAWRTATNSTVFSTELQTTVSPRVSTTYLLTVTLPDGSTHTTSAQVTACCPPVTSNDIAITGNVDGVERISIQTCAGTPVALTTTVANYASDYASNAPISYRVVDHPTGNYMLTVWGQNGNVRMAQYTDERYIPGGNVTVRVIASVTDRCGVVHEQEFVIMCTTSYDPAVNCENVRAVYPTSLASAYPSPARESVSFTGEWGKESQGYIYTAQGQLVTTVTLPAHQPLRVVTQSWQEGTYYLRIGAGKLRQTVRFEVK